MKKPPLITLGITCFNAEDTIARAIESARNQDWPNCEIIVVDDASGDGSVGVIEKIAGRDKRIIFKRHKKNGGAASVRNTIIRHARGKYIAFFDDDDDYSKTRITKQYRRLVEFEARHAGLPVLCFTNLRVFFEGETKPAYITRSMGYAPFEPHGPMIADFLFWRRRARGYSFGSTGTSNLMASRKTLRAFPFDEKLRRGEDWDIAIRVGFAGGYCVSVDSPLTDYYIKETPDKAGMIALENQLLLAEKHGEYLRQTGAYRATKCFIHAEFYQHRNRVKCAYYILAAIIAKPIMVVNLAHIATAKITKRIM